MGDVFWLDLVFFGLIALFFLKRLYDVLGATDDDFVVDSSKSVSAPASALTFKQKPVLQDDAADDAQVQTPLGQLKAFDPSFQEADFLDGATRAFEFILEAFSHKKLTALQSLTSPSVFAAFEREVLQQKEAQQTMDFELIRFCDVSLKDVVFDAPKARLSVYFKTEQVSVIKNHLGEILEGDPNRVDVLEDVWVFERDMRSKDPNWLLVDTIQG